jgi:hypothetical protein
MFPAGWNPLGLLLDFMWPQHLSELHRTTALTFIDHILDMHLLFIFFLYLKVLSGRFIQFVTLIYLKQWHLGCVPFESCIS